MRLRNGHQSLTPASSVSTVFTRKDGLLEYTKNHLNDSERARALGRVVGSIPEVTDEVRRFLKLPKRGSEVVPAAPGTGDYKK